MRCFRWRRYVWAAMLAVVVPAGLWAQQQAPVFRSRVDVVRIPVRVVDGGRPVTGLTAEHFRVRDNRVLQEVEAAVAVERLSVAVMVDTSHSIPPDAQAQFTTIRTAVHAALLDTEPTLLATFDEHPVSVERGAPSVLLAPIAPGAPTPAYAPRTALWDTVAAVSATQVSAEGRAYVLVLTDGCDNASWLTPVTIARWLGRTDVTVDIVWYGSSREEFGAVRVARDGCWGPLRLDEAIEQTEGRVFRTADRNLVRDLTQRIAELRASYLLSFTPTGVKRDDGWHQLDVSLQNGARGRVTAREGYYAGGGSD